MHTLNEGGTQQYLFDLHGFLVVTESDGGVAAQPEEARSA